MQQPQLSSTCKISADNKSSFSFVHDKYISRDALNSDPTKNKGLNFSMENEI